MFESYRHRNTDLTKAFEELRHLVRAWDRVSLSYAPEGMRVGVMFLPGIGVLDKTTERTRALLEKFGYETFSSSLDHELNFTPDCLRQIENAVAEVSEYLGKGGHLFLVGHSAGAIVAQGVAKKMPDKITGVFSLGGIFQTSMENITEDMTREAAAEYFADIMNPDDFNHYFLKLDEEGDVPTVSILSNSDQMLPEAVSCSDRSNVHNIRVSRRNSVYMGAEPNGEGPSHMGLIYNIDALRVITKGINYALGAHIR